jgi:uncharacterized membrane protein YfcA
MTPLVREPSDYAKAGAVYSTFSGPDAEGRLRRMSTETTLLAACAIFVLAGFVKGVIGLGLPTVSMGLLGLLMPPAQAAALVVVPSLFTNLWQLAAGPQFGFLIRRLWPFLAAICAGTWAGEGLLSGDTHTATTALGAALVLYAAFGLSAVKLAIAPRVERWLSPLMGLATGFTGAATGVFVLPAVPYFQALGFDKEDFVQALGLSFTVSTLALAVDLARSGAFAPSIAGSSLVALAPALAGMALGGHLRASVHPNTFRRWLFLGLLALGAYLALR